MTGESAARISPRKINYDMLTLRNEGARLFVKARRVRQLAACHFDQSQRIDLTAGDLFDDQKRALLSKDSELMRIDRPQPRPMALAGAICPTLSVPILF
jgi:hypothetical protein